MAERRKTTGLSATRGLRVADFTRELVRAKRNPTDEREREGEDRLSGGRGTR